MQPLKNITIPITAGLGISVPFVKHLPDNKKMKKPIIVIPIKIYSILNTDIFIPPSFKNFANTDHTYLVKISMTESCVLLLLDIYVSPPMLLLILNDFNFHMNLQKIL